MTFFAFRPFRLRKHRKSYIKISQILKLKSKDITSKTLRAKFYASRIKNKRIYARVKYAPPWVWSVFKSPGKIGLTLFRPGGSLGTPPKVSVHSSLSFCDNSLKFGEIS